MGDITRNFSRFEFGCKCGCGFDEISPILVDGLQEIRDLVGQAIHVASGCRCPEHNTRVGGVINSFHVMGMAADITCRWLTPRELKKYAEKFPAFRNGGIGIYKGFLHVDIRPYKARWG